MIPCPRCKGQVFVSLDGLTSCLQCGWAPPERPLDQTEDAGRPRKSRYPRRDGKDL